MQGNVASIEYRGTSCTVEIVAIGGSMGFHVACVACWRLWDLCGAHMFDWVAAVGSIEMGAAAAVAAQHDHFDQVQTACIGFHIHGWSLQW